jgi:threonine aldolase
MATRLAQGLQRLPLVALLHPVEANEVFIQLPQGVIAGLKAAGFNFYDWTDGPPGTVRLVTAFNTDPAHVEAFVATATKLAAAAA